MAQGDSPVSICNGALIALGCDPIVSIAPPDANKRAALCAVRYNPVRRTMLRRRPWSCAKWQASLAASPTAPAFGPGNAYTLPTDFLRFWEVDANGDWIDPPKWITVGSQVLTDSGAPLNIWYVRDLQDCTVMDSLLVRCIELALAADLAIALTQDQGRKDKATADMEALLEGDASLVTSQENTPVEWDEDVWLRARDY